MFTMTALEQEAVYLSLLVSGWAVAGSLPLGILCAWILARSDFPGKSVFDGLIHLPLVLPPVVVGYFLLVMLGRRGPIEGALYDWLGITIAFTWKGAAIASTVISFPLPFACRWKLLTGDWSKRPAPWAAAQPAPS